MPKDIMQHLEALQPFPPCPALALAELQPTHEVGTARINFTYGVCIT